MLSVQYWIDVGLVFWLSLVIVAANMLPVVFGRNGHAIDRGYRPFRDGQSLFGSSKTWEGLIGGIVGGTCVGVIFVCIAGLFHWRPLVMAWGDTPVERFWHILSLSVGVLFGDLAKSFIKRRLKIGSGQAWPIVDQMDAIVGAFLVGWLVDLPVSHGSWFAANFLPGRWDALKFLIPFYLLTHPLCSWVAHRNGLKSNPH